MLELICQQITEYANLVSSIDFYKSLTVKICVLQHYTHNADIQSINIY